MKKRNLLFIFFLLVTFRSFAQEKIDPFQHWQFRNTTDSSWIPATVPGTVHADLFNNNKIPDPFFGLNEYNLQWIEKADWEYKCTFDVPYETFNKTHINIVFEGLDTYAKVYLNGSLILTADNMFREWQTDCKPLLKKKDNLLRVVFQSAVKIGMQDSSKSKYILPGGIRVYTRIAQYQYGWDWSPRYVTCGIWKPVYLEAWNDIKIQSVGYYQDTVTSTKANLHLIAFATSDKFQECKIILRDQLNGKILKEETIALAQGLNRIPLKFIINNPQLWWTNGLGNPNLYHFEFDINKGGKKICSDSCKVGIRTIELLQRPDSVGKSFYFKLNGVPVFMKGANYIPADNFIPRVSKNDYEKLINTAVDCNMNMLRVWGGGIYEDDNFYDLCDEKGILVWQDFMFACGMYPADTAFLNNVKNEATYQVNRLTNHPCIALWCGNNEISEGWYNWDWQKQYGYSANDSAKIWNNYTLLFDTLIKNVVNTFDAKTPYWPSSPKYGWGRKESLLEGDSHYWGVWWGMEPFSMYENKIGRFMSEYGFQAYPADETMKTYLDFKTSSAGDNMNPFWHNKHPQGFQTIDNYLLRDYYNATDHKNAVKHYTYLSQLLQANGITTAIEAHRRARPYCMGTLYWQFNDCWPGVSWSGMDYYGRWKALQYFVKKAYSDILVTVTEKNKTLETFVVSDVQKTTKAKLCIFLSDFNGKKIWQKDTLITIQPLSSSCCFTIPVASIIKDTSANNKLFFAARLYIADSLASQAVHYFVPYKLLKLPKANIKRSLKISDNKIELSLSSKTLAKNVYVSLDDKYLKLSDNYFDILPGDEVKIHSEESISSKIKVRKIKLETFNSK